LRNPTHAAKLRSADVYLAVLAGRVVVDCLLSPTIPHDYILTRLHTPHTYTPSGIPYVSPCDHLAVRVAWTLSLPPYETITL